MLAGCTNANRAISRNENDQFAYTERAVSRNENDQSEAIEFCKGSADFAFIVMTAKMRGTSKSKQLLTVKGVFANDPKMHIAYALVNDAYTIFMTPTEFSSESYNMCMDAYHNPKSIK